MDIIKVLPSPPQFFRLFFRLSLSLLNSTINANCRKSIADRRSPISFDVDPLTGFFPRRPLPKLSDEFVVWEEAIQQANGKLSLGEDESYEAMEKRPFGEQWRAQVASLPVLDTEPLHTNLRLSQRAHFLLAWMVHFYVHSIPKPEDGDGTPIQYRIPKSLAMPLVQISNYLGIAPVLTFADTVLWNWDLIHPDQPLSIDNMRFLNLFSGTQDEENFYRASAKAELYGIDILRIINDYISLPSKTDFASVSRVAKDLSRLAGVVDDVSEVIQSVRPVCDPHVFYWDIRPWFEGSDAKGPGALGWVYEGIDDSSKLDLSGPSAGQSSVMHALDIFLDIDHKLRQKRYPVPSTENKRADHGFMERMRRYMPGKHREYLAYVGAIARPIRKLAQENPVLREPYDSAVIALKRLRDRHIRIACLYVVSMSQTTSRSGGGCPASAMIERLQTGRMAGNGAARGTGGNELSNLLKAGRDATRRAILKGN